MGKFLFRFFTGAHAKIIKLTRGRLLANKVLVLTHKGAKSGKVRDTPLMYFPEGDRYLIVASAGGAPQHPGWYYNLLANPETVVVVGGDEIAVTAREAGPERDELWEKIKTTAHQFAQYEARTERTIPVMILEPR